MQRWVLAAVLATMACVAVMIVHDAAVDRSPVLEEVGEPGGYLMDYLNKSIPELNSELHSALPKVMKLPKAMAFMTKDKHCLPVEEELVRLPNPTNGKVDDSMTQTKFGKFFKRMKKRASKAFHAMKKGIVKIGHAVKHAYQSVKKKVKKGAKAVKHWFLHKLPCVTGGVSVQFHELIGLDTITIMEINGNFSDASHSVITLDLEAEKLAVTGHYKVYGEVLGIKFPVSGDFKVEGLGIQVDLPFSFSTEDDGCDVPVGSIWEDTDGTVDIEKMRYSSPGTSTAINDAIISSVVSTDGLAGMVQSLVLPFVYETVNSQLTSWFHPSNWYESMIVPYIPVNICGEDYVMRLTQSQAKLRLLPKHSVTMLS